MMGLSLFNGGMASSIHSSNAVSKTSFTKDISKKRKEFLVRFSELESILSLMIKFMEKLSSSSYLESIFRDSSKSLSSSSEKSISSLLTLSDFCGRVGITQNLFMALRFTEKHQVFKTLVNFLEKEKDLIVENKMKKNKIKKIPKKEGLNKDNNEDLMDVIEIEDKDIINPLTKTTRKRNNLNNKDNGSEGKNILEGKKRDEMELNEFINKYKVRRIDDEDNDSNAEDMMSNMESKNHENNNDKFNNKKQKEYNSSSPFHYSPLLLQTEPISNAVRIFLKFLKCLCSKDSDGRIIVLCDDGKKDIAEEEVKIIDQKKNINPGFSKYLEKRGLASPSSSSSVSVPLTNTPAKSFSILSESNSTKGSYFYQFLLLNTSSRFLPLLKARSILFVGGTLSPVLL
jgi:hypothetical protein